MGKSKNEALGYIKQKIVAKLQGWKSSLLSQAGREILIKAVATTVPTYAMSCFKFPKNGAMI